MRCDVAEREISARLDGAEDRRATEALEAHLAGCVACRSFEARARRLRELVRLEPAGAVPDLVPRIISAVAGSPKVGAGRRAGSWRDQAAAFAAGAAAAAIIVGGLPGVREGGAPALATEIPRRVAAASRHVNHYRATFAIEERNFHPAVPVRRFTARIGFEAPERFSAHIRDVSRYANSGWTRTEIRLTVDRDRWALRAPVTCPREALPACAPGRMETHAVRGREPFDGDAPLPTDVILPLRTLSGTERVDVVREDVVLGRRVVVVAVAYRDALPLFGYLHAGGAWRPFFPLDRVIVSLDRETWFPLAYQVHPAVSPERRAWAQRHSLPPEAPDRPVFVARARSFAVTGGRGGMPAPPTPRESRDDGFRDLPFPRVAERAILPADTAGLAPYRAGEFAGAHRTHDEMLLSFTRGLAWLKIRETRGWTRPSPFGDVGGLATPVRLGGGGIAYYEPASEARGRRLAIHSARWDVYVETNLPLAGLLRVASSLPVRGLPAPPEWLGRRGSGSFFVERVSLDAARESVSGVLLPERLPAGYRLGPVQLARADGRTAATMYFRRRGAELDGVGIRLHQAPGEPLPPPMDPGVVAVRVRGTIGRYSAERAELEWVERGVYRSLRGSGLDLTALLGVAESLR